ncbi:hypothetical protein SDC9_148354 [bioreactor metagenome]|uniref:Uncharacterized protein n=1 Tax=bioreactor metagenome TaxID=1076179 RepID=A0A645EGV2_9ZZZZ
MSDINTVNKYPIITPIPIPTPADTSNSFTLAPIENSPLVNTPNNVETNIAPTASLNADSLTTVCFILSFIVTCLKTGIRAAGSVDATTDPKSKAVTIGSPKTLPDITPTTTADTITPTVDNIPTLILTLFNTFKFISFPPSNNINADPNVNIRLFSTGKDCTLIMFKTAGPIIIPAIK